RDAAAAGSVRKRVSVPVESVTPRAKSHGPGQFLMDILLHFHARQVAEYDRSNVRGTGRVGIAAAGLGPHRSSQRDHILIQRFGRAGNRIELLVDTINDYRIAAFPV